MFSIDDNALKLIAKHAGAILIDLKFEPAIGG
jgi:hypothetical protein